MRLGVGLFFRHIWVKALSCVEPLVGVFGRGVDFTVISHGAGIEVTEVTMFRLEEYSTILLLYDIFGL